MTLGPEGDSFSPIVPTAIWACMPRHTKETPLARENQHANADYSSLRRHQPDQALQLETLRWLGNLPDAVRPKSLPVEFPRIANSLCDRWSEPKACLEYLDDLVIDHRGNRTGFPGNNALEIAALKNFFETDIFPTNQTTWEHITGQHR